MLKLRILLIALFITSQSIYSQVDVQILVKQSLSKQAKLFIYQQSGSVLVDSSNQQSQGLFKFSLPASYKQGRYKFLAGKNISFDFIVASEPRISIETVVFAAEDSAKSIISKENEVYFKYQKIKKRLNQQTWFLNSLLDYYHDSTSFRKQLMNERYKVQTELINESKGLAKDNPNLYSSNLILLETKPIAPVWLSTIDGKMILRQSWWEPSTLKDTRFINSPSLESKLWGYFELYFDDNFTKEQQDSAFVSAVKELMSLDANPSIKSYLRNTLFENYAGSDYDAVAKYLSETSFDGISPMSLTPEEKNGLEIQRQNGVGEKAKDFSLKISDGTKLKLSKINAPYKLIVFWSMWCPHCTEMIPELYKTYLKHSSKGFEVVAICIDDELEGWKRYVNEKKQTWINAIEPDNGENKIIKEYNVEGTPMLFLIDKNMTIISRPSNVNQLEAKLKKILKYL